MPHPYAKTDFGTGLVMICSFGDYGDVRVLRELDINPTYSIGPDGKMTNAAGKYRGMSVKEARAAILEDLKAAGLLEKQEQIAQRQPICWRSKNPIEFVPMQELYLKQIEFKDDLLKIAADIKFYAPESRQILVDWINSINIDWVISRRRFYGTEIPLWHCDDCKEFIVPQAGKYYQPWKQSSPVKVCPKCGGRKIVGDTRTFDTWFDSSSSEYYILGYIWDKAFWKKAMPCTLRPQGKEIVRTWLYFSLLKAWLLDAQKAFENCWIHMHVIDEKEE
jgi:valyl-tRNA synthetase